MRAEARIELLRPRQLRGEAKLRAALAAFAVDVGSRVALDVGAAAGGFTRALLDAGAARVYAVDAGYGQLLGSLRQDARVVVLERTNLGELDRQLVPEPVQVVTIDLSYLSLARAAPQLERVEIAADTDLLALVKPMFELGLGRPPLERPELERALATARNGLQAAGWHLLGSIESPLRGAHGAIEVLSPRTKGVLMLTHEHIEHYKTFGYVVLRRQLDEEKLKALSQEVDRAFLDAFGRRFRERPRAGGIEGHYLPVMSVTRTPVSLELVESLQMVAQWLLGATVLPTPALAILFFGEAPWHDDTGFAVSAVKFAAYLEPLAAGNGALRVLPGSHLDAYRELAKRFERRVMPQRDEELADTVERLPGHVLATQPGDVIAFDLRLYHASIHGRDRHQWTVTYYRNPETPEETEQVKAALADEVAADYGSWNEYDPECYPFYDPDWVATAERDWRARSIDRLRELGVFEAAGKERR